MKKFVGLDPGGIGKFGWASLTVQDSGDVDLLLTGVCSTAPDAVKAASDALPYVPLAIGIDAPLFWVKEGDRSSDRAVRSLVHAAGGNPGTVMHVNSLQGACLVQGIIAARIARDLWLTVAVTEAHPKALRVVHAGAQRFLSSHLPSPTTEHDQDAALAAYAAWALVDQFSGWHDLAVGESAPFFPSGFQVAYWFPEQ